MHVQSSQSMISSISFRIECTFLVIVICCNGKRIFGSRTEGSRIYSVRFRWYLLMECNMKNMGLLGTVNADNAMNPKFPSWPDVNQRRGIITVNFKSGSYTRSDEKKRVILQLCIFVWFIQLLEITFKAGSYWLNTFILGSFLLCIAFREAAHFSFVPLSVYYF